MLPRDTKFGGGGRVGERQMMDMMDRHKRAVGEKMVALLLIMIKKSAFPSPCAEQEIPAASDSFT